jgi:hypothetical protein
VDRGALATNATTLRVVRRRCPRLLVFSQATTTLRAVPASQLPVQRVVWARKKPGVAYDTGLLLNVESGGQVSQAQRMPGQPIRRTIGEAALATAFGFGTRPQRSHRSLS